MPRKKARTRSKTPSKNWTVRELREYISENVENINKITRNYAEQAGKGSSDKRYEQQIKKLQKSTGQKKMGRGEKIIKGLRKKKEELLKQAKQFVSFFKFAEKTPPAEEFENKKVERAYQSFTGDYGEMKREEYERMVNVFGNINFSDWGYEANADNIVGNVQEYVRKGFSTQELVDTMNRIAKEVYKRGKTPESMMQRLDDVLTGGNIVDFQYYADKGKSPEEVMNAMEIINETIGLESFDRNVDYLNVLDKLLGLVD